LIIIIIEIMTKKIIITIPISILEAINIPRSCIANKITKEAVKIKINIGVPTAIILSRNLKYCLSNLDTIYFFIIQKKYFGQNYVYQKNHL